MNPQILYDIFEKVKQKENRGKDIIKLNVGEPELKPPQLLFFSINQSFKEGRITYGPTAGDEKLRKLLAKHHGVSLENVLIGPGSKFLIYAALKFLLKNKDDEVILPLPAWSAYPLMIADLKIGNVCYLTTTFAEKWQINIDKLSKSINKYTKVLILTNPNNPTSLLSRPTTVNEINNITKVRKITLIKDCAYQDLSFKKQISLPDLESTIEIHSFSKKFCMTGFRIGYVIAEKEIIEKLTKFIQITVSCVPLFIQDGAAALLEKQPLFPRKIVKIYEKRAKIVGEMLTRKGINFIKPEAGFYIFANLHIPTEQFCLNLIDYGVALVPGTAFGPYPTYVRISLTETEEKLFKAIDILLKRWKSQISSFA